MAYGFSLNFVRIDLISFNILMPRGNLLFKLPDLCAKELSVQGRIFWVDEEAFIEYVRPLKQCQEARKSFSSSFDRNLICFSSRDFLISASKSVTKSSLCNFLNNDLDLASAE